MLLLVAVLASARPNPGTIAVDRNAVYWIENDAIGRRLMSVAKTGGLIKTLGAVNGEHLIADGERLFFIDSSGLESLRPGGIAHRIASGEGAVDLFVHGPWIYWRNAFGQLRRAARADGLAQTVREGFAGRFAVDDDGVYPLEWFASAHLLIGDAIFYAVRGVPAHRRGLIPSSGSIWRRPKSGGEPVVLADHQNAPAGDMISVGDHLYWVNTGDRLLVRMSAPGGTVESIARAIRFAVDASGVYAVTPDGDIVTFALDDRPAPGPAAPRAGDRGRIRRGRPASSAWPTSRAAREPGTAGGASRGTERAARRRRLRAGEGQPGAAERRQLLIAQPVYSTGRPAHSCSVNLVPRQNRSERSRWQRAESRRKGPTQRARAPEGTGSVRYRGNRGGTPVLAEGVDGMATAERDPSPGHRALAMDYYATRSTVGAAYRAGAARRPKSICSRRTLATGGRLLHKPAMRAVVVVIGDIVA
jgi:hypothetical protein